MSVYTEDANGNLVLVSADKTVEDIVAENKAALEAAGEIASPCVKELLNADITKPATEVVNPGTPSVLDNG